MQPTVGVFDSGVGGLSVLAALCRAMPDLALHYIADSGHAPYGERDAGHVIDRSSRLTARLVAQGARVIVVACNTATALAVETLRAQWPALQIVGVEPGLRPAAAATRNGRIGVLATPATLRSPRFQALLARETAGHRVVQVPCPGLAAAIERGPAAEGDIDRLLDQFCAPLRDGAVDTVVLGCTHYPFAAARISQQLGPEVTLIDTAVAVARRALQLWPDAPARAQCGEPAARTGQLRLESTGNATQRALLERLAHDWLPPHGAPASALRWDDPGP
jgi:glutamate racemase